jgi:hypothetical protein
MTLAAQLHDQTTTMKAFSVYRRGPNHISLTGASDIDFCGGYP